MYFFTMLTVFHLRQASATPWFSNAPHGPSNERDGDKLAVVVTELIATLGQSQANRGPVHNTVSQQVTR
jgi:hypothetical protein